ncbi:hypothetical protein Bca52824_084356 [Brassica carinata]|uniref:Pentatricopeptide repeat-containing protein n=1 Tax=Brassica carinata TaxID=52824 RepID=A0A8X7TTN0_BRACI|nr:hypothetical protein Bca52824_084356 [Brassica carinata]
MPERPNESVTDLQLDEKEETFKHTLSTYRSVIEKLGLYGKFEAMEQVLVDLRQNDGFYECEPTVFSYNAIMSVLVDAGYFDQAHKDEVVLQDARPHAALRLLDNMSSQGCEMNAVACCTVVGGFYEEGFKVEAFELFGKMLASGVSLCVSAFNRLMHVLCKKGDVEECEKLLEKVIKRGVLPNLFTYNFFILGLCQKGELDAAVRMVACLVEQGPKPDVVTYNNLICGLCKSSKFQEAEFYLGKCAERILGNAVFNGIVPDEFTYRSLIEGLCHEGETNRALALFNEALGKGIKPNVILYNTLIKGLSKHGLILEAAQLATEMTEKGFDS